MDISSKAGMMDLTARLQDAQLRQGAADAAGLSQRSRKLDAADGDAAKVRAGKEADLMKACQDFESVFISYLFERMRAAGPQSSLDSGLDHEIFTSMSDQETSKQMSRAGGLGLSKVIFDQMKKQL
jgi:Rod binding domain-containing protein